MKHSLDDTIAAIATPVGVGGVGVIRISGTESLSLLKSIFLFSKEPIVVESHRAYHGWVLDPKASSKVDEALSIYMKRPNSYTGEDVAEIDCHGGGLILKRILEIIISYGARLAEPGEFTKRAFLNGKIDLLQAEAVVDLVKARSNKALEAAAGQLAGKLSAEIREIRKELILLLSEMEAGLDFPEDVGEVTLSEIYSRIRISEDKINRLIETAEEGRVVREGIRVAIVGKPNVGKSSLLNCLLGEDRAIVTAIPGTTRDTIEETIILSGFPLIVIDTAGIRHPKDEAEAFGVAKAKEEMKGAELTIMVIDASQDLSSEDQAILDEAKKNKAMVALNKIDLGVKDSTCRETKQFKSFKVSALKGIGLAELKQGIIDQVIAKPRLEDNGLTLINERHKELLEKVRECLIKAEESCKIEMAVECVAIDIKGAIIAMGEISGENVSEEVVNEIFKQFCVGK